MSELSAITDKQHELQRCQDNPSWEWSKTSKGPNQEPDSGDGASCFWNGRADTVRNAERIEQLERLFVRKYPGIVGDIPPPVCDGE